MLVRRARGGRYGRCGAWTVLRAGSTIRLTVAGSRRAVSLVTVGAAVMTMAAMATVKEVHQRAQREQEERQGAHQVGPVLREKEKAGHGDEAEEDPWQGSAPP